MSKQSGTTGMVTDPFMVELILHSRISFKMPGFTLGVYTNPAYFGSSVLTMEVRTQDTYNPGKTLTVSIRHPLYLPCPEDHVIRQIQQFVRETVKHEADEWFRVDGEIFDDPHKRER